MRLDLQLALLIIIYCGKDTTICGKQLGGWRELPVKVPQIEDYGKQLT